MPWPRSSSRIQPATLSRKYRSWVIATTVPPYSLRNRSSHATDSASRWFVGSSSNSMSGRERRSRQSATRRRSPPEILATSMSPGGTRSASIASSTVRSRSQAFTASIRSCNRACSSSSFSISSASTGSPRRALTSSKRVSRARTSATPSSTLARTSFAGSSWGSCGRYPMRSPAAGNASPRKSLSTPAMIRSNVDLPAPLAPSTPILAPWKNESQMPRRISRLGGTTFRRSFMTNAYSPAILSGERGLRPPLDSPRLGEARLHEATVLRHHAAVLDHPDPSPRELLGSRVVPDPELEPDRLRSPRQRQDLVGVARKVFGTTEDLDHVSRLREIFQSGHRRRVMETTAGELRIHGLDAGAASYEVGRHVLRRLGRVSLGTEHRHDPGLAKDRCEACIVVDEMDTPIAHGEVHLLTTRPARQ